jgi:hypothetical protein
VNFTQLPHGKLFDFQVLNPGTDPPFIDVGSDFGVANDINFRVMPADEIVVELGKLLRIFFDG